MFGSLILEVAIGMVFVYLLMSLICSAANEIIESVLKNRATDLERGLRELFNQEGGGHLVDNFYNHPLISGLFRGKYERAADKPIGLGDYLKSTNLPAYIPSRNFTYAVLDLLLHPPTAAETATATARDDAAGMEAAQNVSGDEAAKRSAAAQADAQAAAAAPGIVLDVPATITLDKVREAILMRQSHTQAGRALRTLVEQSKNVEELRKNIGDWFDSAMDRVSGNYKRRTKWIIFAIGFALTALLNVNSITIARSLYTEPALRDVVVKQAEAYVERHNNAGTQQAGAENQANTQANANTGNADASRRRFDEDRKMLEELGLPIGWPNGIDFMWPVWWNPKFNFWDNLLLPLIGWLMTAAAISLGAPFWFDMLNKIMVIRSTVKPHEKSPEESSEDRQQARNQQLSISLKTDGTTADASDGDDESGGGGGTSGRGGGAATAAAAGAITVSEPAPTAEPEVSAGPAPADPESNVDGCDVDFTDEAEMTSDEELPPTKGGVG